MSEENHNKGYKEEETPEGDVLLCVRVRSNGKWEVRKISLSDLVIQQINRKKSFAKLFQSKLTA